MTSAPGTRWLFATAAPDHPRLESQDRSITVLCADLWTGEIIGYADIPWERDEDDLFHLNAQAVDADTIVLSLANLGAKW